MSVRKSRDANANAKGLLNFTAKWLVVMLVTFLGVSLIWDSVRNLQENHMNLIYENCDFRCVFWGVVVDVTFLEPNFLL